MASIQIAAQDIQNYAFEGTLHELWIVPDRAWIAEDGGAGQIVQSDFPLKFTITVVGTTATIPTVTLYSTTDAPVVVDRNARYSAFIYVDGAKQAQFMPDTLGSFAVPATPTTTTWGDVESFNNTPRRVINDLRTYSAEEINEQLADIVAGAISGPAGGDLTGVYPNPELTITGVSAATYGDDTHVAAVTVNAKGRITAASEVAITGLLTTGVQTISGAKTFSSTITGNLTGNVTGDVTGNVSGNAGTVTNGVYLDSVQTLTNKTLTSPTLTTPALGVATATSINKVAITAPAASATLTIANGKTLTASNTLTLAGTDGTTMTFPNATDTVVGLAATQTLTNKTLTSPVMTTPTLGVASATSLAASGAVTSSSASAGIGYATGAGGTVTQITSKSTGVTLNKVSGAITTHNASLAAGAEVSFTVTNSTVAATDVVVVCIKSGGTAGAYAAVVDAVAAGSFQISLSNLSAGALGEALVLNFVVIKAVAA